LEKEANSSYTLKTKPMEKVLVVEDDPNIRQSLLEILSLAGYESSGVKDGKEGLNAILETTPDLVICDVSMPELSGFELLEAINHRMRDQVIPPFMFLTAKVEPQDIRQGMSLGADDYILKPFDHKDLLQAVRMRLDKRKKIVEGNGPKGPVSNNGEMNLNKIALPSDTGLILVPFEEIVFCEAERAYCRFHLESGKKMLISKAMKEFEPILTQHQFVKVHKSYIVNVKHIEKYIRGTGGQLLMTDGSLVAVSARKKESLMQLLRN